MSKIVICGGKELHGTVRVHGAKNSVLPILAATVLNAGSNTIYDCPHLTDVDSSINILENLGCKVDFKNNTANIDSKNINNSFIPEKLMREMRSSVIFLGAIIGRCRRAVISYPGGCELGPRPIDLHLKAFRQLGVNITESHGYIYCDMDRIKCQTIHLAFPSVGATENIMLLATLGDGETIITNAAREPEIVDLQNYLNGMGAKISGAGGEVIVIEGVSSLHSVSHTVMPDRIVAATYLCAVAVCKGDVTLTNVVPSHLQSAISILSEAGCEIETTDNTIHIVCKNRLKAVDMIKTLPYPAFPTDAQAPVMAALCTADGTTIFKENMFENRYKHVEELVRMGADITVDSRMAVVRGVEELQGAMLESRDLRGGAALFVAGLKAKGISEITGLDHIDRGYENIVENYTSLGAEVKRVDDM